MNRSNGGVTAEFLGGLLIFSVFLGFILYVFFAPSCPEPKYNDGQNVVAYGDKEGFIGRIIEWSDCDVEYGVVLDNGAEIIVDQHNVRQRNN